jgi:hypothetical protein
LTAAKRYRRLVFQVLYDASGCLSLERVKSSF